MKPSEYLIKLDFIMDWSDDENKFIKFHCPDYSLNDVFVTKIINSLNKKFTDKYKIKENIFTIIKQFASESDVDGKEELYQFTYADLNDLKDDILKLFEE